MKGSATNGFPVRRIADVCDVVNGGTPKTGERSFWDGPHQWITPAEMGKRQSPYVETSERTLTAKGLDELSGKLVPPKSVILSSRAPIGHLVINTVPMAFNQGCKGLVPQKELNYKFLYYYLYSIRDELDAMGTGATFRELSGGRLKEVSVPVPPLPEQRRIVGILDEAFAGIATAKANAEKNLRNARELFESELRAVFSHAGGEKLFSDVCEISASLVDPRESAFVDLPHVGGANIETKTGVLMDLKTAREEALKSGKFVFDGSMVLYSKIRPYLMKVSRPDFRGLSSADIYPLVPKPGALDRDYLFHLLLSPDFTAYAIKGSARAGMPKVNREHLFAYRVHLPPVATQKRQAAQLDSLAKETQHLASLYQQKLAALDALKKSLLHQAFSGQLLSDQVVEVPGGIPFPVTIPNISPTDLHAGILAIACEQHEIAGRIEHFTHVKAEKIAHLIEARLGIDLGRRPVKDAAGPNDFKHLKKVEHRARKTNAFDFKQTAGGAYRVTKLHGFDRLIAKTRAALGDRLSEVEKLLHWMLPMSVQQAEIAATVYAAWNNLLLDGKRPSDEEIVYESRENWHSDKLKIDRDRFFSAVQWLRDQGVMPAGKGKRVEAKGGEGVDLKSEI